MMTRFSRLLGGLRAILRQKGAEGELDEEMSQYLEEAARAHIAAGMSEADAYRAARLDVGGVEAVKEAVRDVGWESVFLSVWQDVRYAIRLMRKAPGFTAAAVLTLGLGIGGSTAVFSVVDALFLRAPDGVADPATIRRVFVRRNAGSMQAPTGSAGIWSDAQELLENGNAFAATAAYELPELVDLDRGEAVRQLHASVVSRAFFDVLGVRPAAGRLFLADDDGVPGLRSVAVISHELWQTRFGLATSAIGQVLVINGQSLEIIGVTPPGFRGIEADPVAVWLPSAMAGPLGLVTTKGDWRIGGTMLSGSVRQVARLTGRATEAVAAQQGSAALQHAAEAYPDLDPTPEVMLKPLVLAGLPERSWAMDLSVWTALAAGCLFLIACANVANLVVGRAVSRRRELAMRMALGASVWRVVRQNLTESVVLGLFGGCAGLVAAWAVMGVMLQFPVPPEAAELNVRLVGFAIAVSLVSSAVFGVAPALRARRVDPISALKGARSADGPGRSRMSRTLVSLQVTLSLALLVGACLFVRSLTTIASTQSGGDWNRLLVISAPVGPPRFSSEAREEVLAAELARLTTLPGVERAAIVHTAPLAWSYSSFWAPPTEPRQRKSTKLNLVGPDYFETVGTRVLAGRSIQASDRAGAELVAVVNEAMARVLGGNQVSVGLCVPVDRQVSRGGCTRIVGVVESQRFGYLDDRDAPTIFRARAQAPTVIPFGVPVLIARMARASSQDGRAIQSGLQSLRSDLPYITVESMDERLRSEFLRFRLGATLFGLFGVLAALLAGIGLYGLLGHFVAERTAEIGVRRALGASRSAVLRVVLGQSLVPASIGLAAGLATALFGTRYLRSLLFGIEARDPLSFGAATAFLFVTAIIATLVPAYRAVRVDPMAALRHE